MTLGDGPKMLPILVKMHLRFDVITWFHWLNLALKFGKENISEIGEMISP